MCSLSRCEEGKISLGVLYLGVGRENISRCSLSRCGAGNTSLAVLYFGVGLGNHL